jgi:hypothetical protein
LSIPLAIFGLRCILRPFHLSTAVSTFDMTRIRIMQRNNERLKVGG